MNLKMLAAALALALVQGAAVAAPVFTDDFSVQPSPRYVSSDTLSPWVYGEDKSIGGGIKRQVGVRLTAGADDSITAEVKNGKFSSDQQAFAKGMTGIFYTGSGLNSLPSLFTGSVTFSLLSNDVQPVTVEVWSISALTVLTSQVITSTITSAPGSYPLTVNLFGTGDFGGDDSDNTDGFAVVFSSPVAGLDFSIDNLALVPAPATLSILGLGLLGVAGMARRKQSA